jgi:maternal-effect protein exuperantia
MRGEAEAALDRPEPGDYQVVTWDLDTTGRRLIDEICQIGGHCRREAAAEPDTFSQYVMPYRNPNPGARRSFGIKVVNIGRYRMLKDLATGKILKTKSEVSALQDFIAWLSSCRGERAGVLLVSHEPQRKVLGPLLLEALHKYHLTESFCSVVKGFCNSTEVVSALGDSATITSLSLRSLCKTVLGDTALPTGSAMERSTALLGILARVAGGEGGGVAAERLLPHATSVAAEQEQLRQLKSVLGTQVQCGEVQCRAV